MSFALAVPTMWKDTTVRKVLHLPKSPRGWRRLYLWSVAPLLIAGIAAVVGFRDGSPAVRGIAGLVSIVAALGFIVLAGGGLYAQRRSG